METAEKRVAFINAQAVCAQAELQALYWENILAMRQGKEPPNGPEKFRAIDGQFMIGHNTVIEYLRDV